MVAAGTAVGADEAARSAAVAPSFDRSEGSLWLAWASATAIVAILEWLLLLLQVPGSFLGPGHMVKLLPLTFGNWLPYALAGILSWRLVGWGAVALQKRISKTRARLLMACLAGALTLPYAIWLANFTFSGAQARVMQNRTLLVAATAAVIALTFALAAWLSFLRLRSRAQGLVWAGALTCGVGALLWLSRAIMPSEYEPLHGFLAVLAVIAASLAGSELGRLVTRASAKRELNGAGALVAWTGIAGVGLAHSEADSWILWSHSAGSRYLTERWTFASSGGDADVDNGRLVIRPDLETDLTRSWREQRAERPAPNIVIFSIDGLVPGRVGAYGYTARPTTPNIDRMARRGMRFTRAFSSYPATKQFNSSLLLGRLVPNHGAPRAPVSFRELAITRLLDQRDYHILVQSWFEPSSRKRFDPEYFRIDTHVAKTTSKAELEKPMQERMLRVEQHLREAAERKEPVFLWMHLLSTHPVGGQFVPHPKFPWGDSRPERYDSAIAGSDLWLPELERLMQAHADQARETFWIICSDHGVRVDTPGRDLYAAIVRVPLIVVGPGLEPATLDEPVEVAVDLAASVVDLAGIAPPKSYDGISLVPLLMRANVGSRMDQRVIPLLRGRWRGAVQGPFKLLLYNETFSFFDSRTDPNEEHNIYDQRRQLAKSIWKTADAELERRMAAFQGKENVEVTNEQSEEDD